MADVTSIYGNPIKDAVARADIATNTQDISDLKDGLTAVESDVTDLKEELQDITNMTVIHWTDGGYIYGGVSVGGTLDLTPRSSQNYAYAIVDASVGDVFLINGTGASNAYLWIFVDSNNAVLSKADVNLTGTNLYITAPSGSAKLVLSTTIAGKGFTAKGETIAKRLANIDVINGTEHRMVAGVIRNSGSGWEFIVNDRHQGDMNCLSVGISDVDGRLFIDYSGIAVKKVISLIAAPDEAFANQGYIIGSSVGLTRSYIQIFQYALNAISANINVSNDGTISVDSNDGGTVAATWNSTDGRIILSHPSIPNVSGSAPYISLTPKLYGRYIPRVYSSSGTGASIEFWDVNANTKVTELSNKMSFVYNRIGSLLVKKEIDPSTLVSESGNIWFMGIFEV